MNFSLLRSPIQRFSQDATQTLRLGYPIIIAHLLQMSMSFVDTLMAGHVGAQDLAGLAIATALYHPVFLLMLGILIALGSIVAQLHGAQKPEEIVKNVIQGLWLSQILAWISIGIFIDMKPILTWLGYEAEVIRVAAGYLRALCWGMPAVYAYLVLRTFNEGLSLTRPNMFFSLLGLGVNIIGNYALMFGHFGFPALGAVGAGWTTGLVHWVMLAAVFIFCQKSTFFVSYRKFISFSWPLRAYLREILRIGIPNGLSIAFEVSLFAVVALMMGTFGATAIAGHQIAINVASMTFMVPMGLSTAITIRVGQAVGRKDFQEARFSGYAGILLCVSVMFGAASLFIFAPELIVGLYTEDSAVRNLAVQLLFMAAIFQLSDGIQVGALGALRGLKDTRVPLLVNILAYWGIGLTSAYVIGIYQQVGPVGMWFGLIAGLSVAAIFHSWRFQILTRRLLSSG